MNLNFKKKKVQTMKEKQAKVVTSDWVCSNGELSTCPTAQRSNEWKDWPHLSKGIKID